MITFQLPANQRFSSTLLVMVALCAVTLIACTDDSSSTVDPTATAIIIPTTQPTEAPTATPEPSPTPTATAEPTHTPTPVPDVREYGFEIINTYPHDPAAWTQGLEFHDGVLFESTGLRDGSSLRRVDLETGEILQYLSISPEYYGEGLTIFDNRIYQITWQEQTAFVYDIESFEVIEQFTYETEGWGLANDGERLFMTDGSNTVFIRNPETFEEIDRIQVYDERGPVDRLNELEYIEGEIWANVWHQDVIVVIDPDTGRVTSRIDLRGLLRPEDQGERRVDVLNGIAYDEETGRIFVTGKLWPVLYEIELIARD